MVRRDVEIYPRRLEVAVPEHGLDGTEIGPIFEEMGGEAMS